MGGCKDFIPTSQELYYYVRYVVFKRGEGLEEFALDPAAGTHMTS